MPVYLSGKAQAALAQVDLDSLDDYEAIKKVLLDSLGDTPASADRRWWSLARQSSEEPGQFYLRVRSTGLRKLYGLKTREELVEHVILSRFMSLLHPDCYSFVIAKQPKTGLEAAKLVQEYEETRSFYRRRQPWKNTHQYRREPSSGNGSNGSNGGSVNGSKEGSGSVSNSNPSKSQNVGTNQLNLDKSNKVEKSYKRERKPIVCFGCGEPGHIRPNCPNKIRRVKSPELSKVMVVEGYLAGRKVNNLRVDTGADADRTVVRQDFVPEGAYTDEVVRLDSWRGAQLSDHKVAELVIKVGEVQQLAKVAVVEHLDCPALLGSDLGRPIIREMMKRVVAQLDGCDSESESEGEPVRITRAQAKKEAARQK